MTPVEPRNVAQYLDLMASENPEAVAIHDASSTVDFAKPTFESLSYLQLSELSNRYANAFVSEGIVKGTRVLLMVRPGIDLIAITFALMKISAVPILIDPGMGMKNLLKCIERSKPKALIALSVVHAVSLLFRGKFKSVDIRITVGKRWCWGGASLEKCRIKGDAAYQIQDSREEDLAAILFTSGSTGPPKGVCYQQKHFLSQIIALKKNFGFSQGEVDLTLLPIFALFNPALGMTSVIPKMNPSRPASVDPAHIEALMRQLRVTNAFGAPVLWHKILSHVEKRGENFPELKRVLMAGAAVPPEIIKRMKAVMPRGEVFTPYGATEALPLCCISGQEVLDETSEMSEQGRGICVGKPFPGIEIRVIERCDQAIARFEDVRELKRGQIGEVIVNGGVVTGEYDQLSIDTQKSKIESQVGVWHRMGDAGYFDDLGRLWFCGRVAHVVQSSEGFLYPDCCEAIFNQHPAVFRSALIGLGEVRVQTPAIVVECHSSVSISDSDLRRELHELALAHDSTKSIGHFYRHSSFPVDVRHNAKIHRLELAEWAKTQKELSS